MKKSSLKALVAASVLSQFLALSAQAETFRVRNQVEVDAKISASLETKGSARVLIVAKEASSHAGLLARSATESRRMVADASTAEIFSIIQEGANLGIRSVPEDNYLWACNAVVADVDAETLAKLQASSSVKQVLLDREIQVLGSEELEPREELAPETIPTNYGVSKIGALQARESEGLTGEGVVVGVIDTGIDGDHPALAGKVIAFKDFVGKKTKAYDDQGHGTHCSGTIAGKGGIGVAPGARLIGAKALNKRGGGTLSGLLKAMQYMLDPDGDPATDDQPDLVSNSWGADADRMGSSKGMFRDIVKAWREAGIVPVFAAGNSGVNTRAVPGGYPESFAVGATDKNDAIARFSTGGSISWDGETFLKPDVSAPGVRIISSVPGGKYRANNGTSMACPHVAGAMALAFQAAPGTGVSEMIQAFQAASLDLGDEGKDIRFGEGRIDVMSTLEVLKTRGQVD